jgi:sugar phosphate isomerase/epimerase
MLYPRQMEFVLCNEVVRDLDFSAQADLAASLGYAGLEVAPFTLDAHAPHLLPAAERRRLRRVASDAGAPILGLHWLLVAPAGLSITAADPELRARTLSVMRGLVFLAADLGAEYLVHGSPGQRRIEAAGDAARAEEALAQAGEWAREAGVTYCLEPLDAGQTNWMTQVAEAAAFTAARGNPHLRAMLDVCASGNGEVEDVCTLLTRHIPGGQIGHIHLNDRNKRAPGQGGDRFGPILQRLQAMGYAGRCGVEPFEYMPDGATCAARAIGYLMGCMQAISSGDAEG